MIEDYKFSSLIMLYLMIHAAGKGESWGLKTRG